MNPCHCFKWQETSHWGTATAPSVALLLSPAPPAGGQSEGLLQRLVEAMIIYKFSSAHTYLKPGAFTVTLQPFYGRQNMQHAKGLHFISTGERI
jgi:hypothetical protein